MAVLDRLAHSTSRLLNPNKNLLLKAPLKIGFYNQFCAGENRKEVQRTMSSLKDLGFQGVMLGYAKEAVFSSDTKENALKAEVTETMSSSEIREIEEWRDGNLSTISLTNEGDFVALK
jgi:proline dehydrogenase